MHPVMKFHWFILTKAGQEIEDILVDSEEEIAIKIGNFLLAIAEFIQTAIYLFTISVNIHCKMNGTTYSSHDKGQQSHRQLLLVLLRRDA